MTQQIKCGTCGTVSPARFARTFLGFRRFVCPACRTMHAFGLSPAVRGLYLAFAALLGYAAYSTGPQNGFLLLVIAYAFFKDHQIRGSVATAQIVADK
jgi:hypothetical protein